MKKALLLQEIFEIFVRCIKSESKKIKILHTPFCRNYFLKKHHINELMNIQLHDRLFKIGIRIGTLKIITKLNNMCPSCYVNS